jgi:hypothetical protein
LKQVRLRARNGGSEQVLKKFELVYVRFFAVRIIESHLDAVERILIVLTNSSHLFLSGKIKSRQDLRMRSEAEARYKRLPTLVAARLMM